MCRRKRYPLGTQRQTKRHFWRDFRGSARQGALEITKNASVYPLCLLLLDTKDANYTPRVTTKHVYDLSWSPDGDYLIAGSTDNTATIWKAVTGECCIRDG